MCASGVTARSCISTSTPPAEIPSAMLAAIVAVEPHIVEYAITALSRSYPLPQRR